MMTLFFIVFLFLFVCGFDGGMIFSVFIFYLFIFFVFNSFLLGLFDLGVVDYFFYIDSIGFIMVSLTLWLFSIVYLISFVGGLFIFFMYYFILFSLFLSFISSSIYMYYIFFEFSILPVFFLIVMGGSGEDRVVSSYYMMVYTLISSLPSLFVLSGIFNFYGYGSFMIYNLLSFNITGVYFVFILFMFVVKIPLFIFHIWLPKAHVDAPVGGSMVLASIMLKLGGYGVFRVLLMFDFDSVLFDFIYCLGLLGCLFLSCLSLFILDAKVLIAYSSVIHMCVMLCGILGGSMIGWVGGLLMMVSHGICSSCMFMMFNMIYLRSGSRCILYNKGIFCLFPLFSYFWLLIIFFNIGAPPSLSLFSELYCMVGIMGVDYFYFFFFLGFFFISCSMINLYNSLNLGWGGLSVVSIFVVEYFCILFHLVPLLFLVFFLFIF